MRLTNKITNLLQKIKSPQCWELLALLGTQIIHHTTKNKFAKGIAITFRFEVCKVLRIGEKSTLNYHTGAGHFSADIVVATNRFVLVACVGVEGLLQCLRKLLSFDHIFLKKHLWATAR